MENKTKIAAALAMNHLNYLCAMAGKIIVKDVEKAMAQHTESYLKRIDSIIEVVKNMKTEASWVAAGNHKMTVMPWADFYRMCV
jgi:hypothetical protein